MKRDMGRTTLILGGARSGKSRFAQQLAEREEDARLIYIATAAAHDAEMEARIARHREDRGSWWETVEEQFDLAGAIRRHGRAGAVLLVDCLTLWLSNLMLAGRNADAATQGLLAALDGQEGQVILVSNEVGWGIVPETPLGRAFRDEAGRLNQCVAAHADAAALIVAGLPLWLKGAAGSPA